MNRNYINREEDMRIIVLCVHNVLKASCVLSHEVDNRILVKQAFSKFLCREIDI